MASRSKGTASRRRKSEKNDTFPVARGWEGAKGVPWPLGKAFLSLSLASRKRFPASGGQSPQAIESEWASTDEEELPETKEKRKIASFLGFWVLLFIPTSSLEPHAPLSNQDSISRLRWPGGKKASKKRLRMSVSDAFARESEDRFTNRSFLTLGLALTQPVDWSELQEPRDSFAVTWSPAGKITLSFSILQSRIFKAELKVENC